MRPADLVAYCRGLPHATEDIKWGKDLCFSIGGKMFAAFHTGNGNLPFGFKCTPEEFERLTAAEGIIPAPYAACFHWVSVTKRDALPLAAARALVRESYELVKAGLPKKKRAALAE